MRTRAPAVESQSPSVHPPIRSPPRSPAPQPISEYEYEYESESVADNERMWEFENWIWVLCNQLGSWKPVTREEKKLRCLALDATKKIPLTSDNSQSI